jgi:phosphatidylinositol kinase/protein kinase (PI-3  family)
MRELFKSVSVYQQYDLLADDTQVLAKIERKLVGYNGNGEKPLAVKKQVQDLIGEATDIENLAQGEFVWN